MWTASLFDNDGHELFGGPYAHPRHLFPTNPKVGLSIPAASRNLDGA